MKVVVGILVTTVLMLNGCASKPQVIVDTSKLVDHEKYRQDLSDCTKLSETYDLSDKTTGNAIVGAAAGGVAVAGIATAIAGAVFAPAIPFIIAGSATGGAVGGGMSQADENKAREKILSECLIDRGYKAYAKLIPALTCDLPNSSIFHGRGGPSLAGLYRSPLHQPERGNGQKEVTYPTTGAANSLSFPVTAIVGSGSAGDLSLSKAIQSQPRVSGILNGILV